MSTPRSHRRFILAPATVIALVAVLILPGGAARAADGVPLYPHGVDAAYSLTSMENPDLSGPALTFELYQLTDPSAGPVVKSQVARIMFWNAATGVNRNIGSTVPDLAVGADQRQPAVVDVAGAGGTRDVYLVWQQWDDPVSGTRDIWLWRGDEAGTADAGFPRLLVQGPAGTNQYAPDVGRTRTPTGNHLVVAWADDRDTDGATTEIYALDLSADTDGDGTPNYLEPAYDPAYAGQRLDPGGDELMGQHEPAVGPKGVFWLDDRAAGGSGESDVYRANLDAPSPVVTRFWRNTAQGPVTQTRATDQGAAWLGPGIAGGPFEPWVRTVGGAAGIITSLADPQSFDVAGMRFALTGGHGGNTDGDQDVFFFDRATGQNVGVCTVGAAPGNRLKVQDHPTIGTARGGARVVWADSRQWTNTPATGWNALAYELYVALVPTVTRNVSTKSVRLGHSVTVSTKVSPGFQGHPVTLQKGTRHTLDHPSYLGGTLTWYTGWTTVKKKDLSAASKASWTWTPKAKGTYYLRVWFKGGRKYADVGDRLVPHVGNASKVVRIVVR